MAKIVWKTTPKAAYEWVEVEGGSTMTEAERKALLDEYVEDNGLVSVEATMLGDVPQHKYGRYKAFSIAAALAPTALPTRGDDLAKANSENDDLRAQIARLTSQLEKKAKTGGADVVDGEDGARGTATGGAQTTEDAREAFNEQSDEKLVGGSEEIRENMDTADRSDDNPVVKRGPGRPKAS